MPKQRQQADTSPRRGFVDCTDMGRSKDFGGQV